MSKKDFKIRLPDGSCVPQFSPSKESCLKKMILFYGGTKTGKSLAMRSYLRAIQSHIEYAIIIAPTEPSNQSYAGMVPRPWIHYDVNMEVLDKLQEMWDLQVMRTGMYNLAWNLDYLKRIYDFCRTTKSDKHVTRIMQRYEKRIKKLPKVDYADNQRIDRIKQAMKTGICRVFRDQIDRSQDILKKASLTKEQRAVVENLHVNPNMVLILDDCAAELKKYMKHDILRLLAYQGRHQNITTFIAAQDDTDIEACFRKNAHMSVFTTRSIYSSFFNRGSHNFDRNTKKYADVVGNEVFGHGDPRLKHVRLVYDPLSTDTKFLYFCEDPPDKFRLGSQSFWDYGSQIAVDDNTLDTHNPFYEVLVH